MYMPSTGRRCHPERSRRVKLTVYCFFGLKPELRTRISGHRLNCGTSVKPAIHFLLSQKRTCRLCVPVEVATFIFRGDENWRPTGSVTGSFAGNDGFSSSFTGYWYQSSVVRTLLSSPFQNFFADSPGRIIS